MTAIQFSVGSGILFLSINALAYAALKDRPIVFALIIINAIALVYYIHTIGGW